MTERRVVSGRVFGEGGVLTKEDAFSRLKDNIERRGEGREAGR